MVEINNQRKAFLECWRGRRELITDVRKLGNHGYDVIVGGELFTDYSITLLAVTLNPKLKSTGAGRYQLLSVGGMPPQAAWPERLLRKSQDAVALQPLRSVALYL